MHNPSLSAHTHYGTQVCPKCASRNYVEARISRETTAWVKGGTVVYVEDDPWPVDFDLEANGVVVLSSGQYAYSENAVVATDEQVIHTNNSYYDKLGEVYVRISEITQDFIVGGSLYDKQLYHPDHVPEGVENPMTLRDLRLLVNSGDILRLLFRTMNFETKRYL
jgi:hypothetical protein